MYRYARSRIHHSSGIGSIFDFDPDMETSGKAILEL
jgi:hypothetical protein